MFGRTLVCTALMSGLLISTATASQLKAVEPNNCYPSFESWVRAQGQKANEPVVLGAPFALTWNSGHQVEVVLAWARDPRSNQPALCVVASRWLGKVSTQAEVE